jgi:hypothetical protein
MAQVKKELVELLKDLTPRELKQLQSTLLTPKLNKLKKKKEQLEKELKQVANQIASLQGKKTSAPKNGRRKKKGRKAKKVSKSKNGRRKKKARKAKAPRKTVSRKGGGKTMAEKIADILRDAGKPMRVREIVDVLVRKGQPVKKGLVNYVNRTLSTSPAFRKAGWGLYTLSGASASKKSAKKKGGRKKSAKKKTARKSKNGRRKGSRKKKAAKKATAAASAS